MGDTNRRYERRVGRACIALARVVAVALSSACGPIGSMLSADVPFPLAVTPVAGTANVPISTEVGIALTGGQITDVALTKAGGAAKIAGWMRDDGTSWIPAAPLAFSSTYDVIVTGHSSKDGQSVTRHTSFTTMGQPGGEPTTGGLYPSSGETVGVAMPVVLDFNPP